MVFPTLIFLGLLPIEANATATLAVWPGTFATMYAYRRELRVHSSRLPLVVALSVGGGVIGALLLLHISNDAFVQLVPYLLLIATLLFTFRTLLLKTTQTLFVHSAGVTKSLWYSAFTLGLFMLIAIYGGFFGAGMGILLLALFSIMGMQNLHEMNALRSCSGLCANSIAIVLFLSSGIIAWPQALIMAVGGVIGGYGGAYYARSWPQSWTRNAVILIGWSMTLYFFGKIFLADM